MDNKSVEGDSTLARNKQNVLAFYSKAFDDLDGKGALELYTGATYKQHNPNVSDDKEGFIKHVQWIADEIPHKENFVRAIAEGDLVALHVVHQHVPNDVKVPAGQEPDYMTYSLVSCDIFKCDENGKIIEHWDAMEWPTFPEDAVGPHKKADGEVIIKDLDKTQENKSLVKSFVETVLIGGNLDVFSDYFNEGNCIQHNMYMEDGVQGWVDNIKIPAFGREISYKKLHRMVAEGNFVWTQCEVIYSGPQGRGSYTSDHSEERPNVKEMNTVLFDLFRIEEGKIVEHWDVLYEELPEEAKNDNTLFLSVT